MKSKDVLRRCYFYIGYLEKKSDYKLESFTENAGTNNYNKFAKICNGLNAKPWCCYFIQGCFREIDKNSNISLLKGLTGSCSTMLQNMSNLIVEHPQHGDIIFFNEKRKLHKFDMSHVGIVIGVDNNYIYTIEGNTSDQENVVVANGGCVASKRYEKNNSRIGYFVRPEYEKMEVAAIPKETVKEGCEGVEVTKLQTFLNYMGIPSNDGKQLKTDGHAGAKTVQSIKTFQKVFKLEVDGSFGAKSRKKAKELLKNE